MTDPTKRSRADNERELRRLYAMYNSLPPEKKASMQGHMQARINELVKAIEGGGKSGGKKGKGMGLLQTILLVVLVSIAALAAGFFGLTYLVKH